MEESKLRFKKFALPVAIITLVSFATYILYWEFGLDVYPEEAISFFEYQPTTNSQNNAAYALSGIRAPKGVKDSYQWAIDRDRYFSTISRAEYSDMQFENIAKSIEGDESAPIPFTQYAEVREPEEKFHYICWLPGGSNQIDRCISEGEIKLILEENQFLIQRYRDALSYQKFDFNTGPSLNHYSIELTKQLAIEIWLRKESLNSDDLNQIARLLWFWKSVADSQSISAIDFAITMVNYGLALELFYQTATLYPSIISIYSLEFGELKPFPVNQDLVNRIAIGDFYSLIPEICISREFDYKKTNSCKNLSTLLFKPGRTIDLIYRNKLGISECKKTKSHRRNDTDIRDLGLQLRLLKRPGNYQGRLYALYMVPNNYLVCEVIDNYRYKNETVGLLALYNELENKNITSKQISEMYETERDSFRIPFSNRYYSWSPETEEIGYIRIEEDREVEYILPFE